MKLSIIIPCYNAEPYIHELIKVLEPQIREGVEVLIIDDGSRHFDAKGIAIFGSVWHPL